MLGPETAFLGVIMVEGRSAQKAVYSSLPHKNNVSERNKRPGVTRVPFCEVWLMHFFLGDLPVNPLCGPINRAYC